MMDLYTNKFNFLFDLTHVNTAFKFKTETNKSLAQHAYYHKRGNSLKLYYKHESLFKREFLISCN